MTIAEFTSMDALNIARGIFFLAVIAAAFVVPRSSWWAAFRAKRRAMASPFTLPNHPAVEAPADVRVMPTNRPIDAVRALMGPAPRAFATALNSYLTVMPPKWLEKRSDDEQWLNIRSQQRIRRDGLVVWATIVQANNYLFQRINVECGDSVIYSADPWFDEHREALEQIAHRCFALKGKDQADPESAAFSRMLTNELTRAMRMRVPGIFTGGREVYHSSMLMPRKHLPKGVLSGVYFPVWMDRQATGAVIMVPAAYWPSSLTMEWDQDQE